MKNDFSFGWVVCFANTLLSQQYHVARAPTSWILNTRLGKAEAA
jgi:hypothetical protein